MSRSRALAALVLGFLSIAAGSAAAAGAGLEPATRDHGAEHTALQWVLGILDEASRELFRRLNDPLADPRAQSQPGAEGQAQ